MESTVKEAHKRVLGGRHPGLGSHAQRQAGTPPKVFRPGNRNRPHPAPGFPSCVSKWYTRDGSRVPHLLDGFDGDIASLTGDRGYDQRSVYRSVAKKNHGAATVIHPRSNAILSGTDEWRQRDRHVHKIRREGVETWRRESGYYRQSTVENTFYRYKTIIGRRLRARGEAARQVEAAIACKILNGLLEQGRAESVPVA